MPFVRLIIPLIAGIIIQFYGGYALQKLFSLLIFFVIGLAAFSFVKFKYKFTLRWIQGSLINMVLLTVGALVVYQNDIKHSRQWVGHYSADTMVVMATLQEPLVQKSKSYKAEATVNAVKGNGQWQPAKGRLLIYFSRDSNSTPALHYGSQVVFTKPLQTIKNSGNPGNFDYKQFNAFKDIYHQVFLKSNDYIVAPTSQTNAFQSWLYNVRSFVISRLQRYIPGSKEAGVAEALLIGYRDDLDKDLVQAYSNTGVVHIIAISGLHLGMIYGLLVLLFKLFSKKRWAKWAKPIVILIVLWVFTLLAGGVPSILRSAVMFTFIIFGEAINRKSSIYNTLASSAFVMLCYNPYFLWDIGFQLSYVAVVSIVAFSRPVYHWMFIENKILDFFWNLVAVTISAQILTLPIIFYSFHQFPNLCLITNCLVVPLSTIVLFAELIVLIVSPWTVVAKFCGIVTGWLLWLMNTFIEKMSNFPFAVTDYIQNSLSETIVLYASIVFLSLWLMRKNKIAMYAGMSAFLIFIALDAVEIYKVRRQQKIIVYNVPKQQAIDFVSGSSYTFVGDPVLTEDGYLRNFHLKPARTLYQALYEKQLNGFFISRPFILFNGKKILLIDKPYKFEDDKKIAINTIIISKNPRLKILEIVSAFDCKQFVFDGSNSMYKINKWKRECDSLQLSYHITNEDGAFEMGL